MTADRAWFEMFESYAQFYPKLSVAIALGTMNAAARMIPQSVNGAAPARAASAPARVTRLAAARKAPRKSAARKGSSARKASKVRRKAA
jgi:hypothetical protein